MAYNLLTDARRNYGTEQFVCDTVEDLQLIPFKEMGTFAFVIETSDLYIANSTGEWVLI